MKLNNKGVDRGVMARLNSQERTVIASKMASRRWELMNDEQRKDHIVKMQAGRVKKKDIYDAMMLD